MSKARNIIVVIRDTVVIIFSNNASKLIALAKGAKVKLLSNKGSNSALVAFMSYNQNAIKSFNNLQGIATEELRSLNPVALLAHKYLIIENPEKAFVALVARVKTK